MFFTRWEFAAGKHMASLLPGDDVLSFELVLYGTNTVGAHRFQTNSKKTRTPILARSS